MSATVTAARPNSLGWALGLSTQDRIAASSASVPIFSSPRMRHASTPACHVMSNTSQNGGTTAARKVLSGKKRKGSISMVAGFLDRSNAAKA